MKTKTHDTIRIHDLQNCDPRDATDISKLMELAANLVNITKKQKNLIKLTAYAQHALAFAGSFYAIKAISIDNKDKIILLMYLPIIIYCAKNGFDADNTAKQLSNDYQDILEKYNSVKQVLETVSPQQIHEIAETYRTDLAPNINTDNLKSLLHHIVIRYQR